jgi:hypothetical protein
MGQEVMLMNPRSARQKVASGTISGLPGEHKFHFIDIPEKWFKVDVREIYSPNVTLMLQNLDADQLKVKDVLKGNTVWDGKYIKSAGGT